MPEAITAAESTDAALSAEPAEPGTAVPTSMPSVFRARSVATASGTYGHLRVFTFNVQDPDGFLREFVRLIGLLPQERLILDVRGNGGGLRGRPAAGVSRSHRGERHGVRAGGRRGPRHPGRGLPRRRARRRPYDRR
ncbi:hypothetical protein [Nonomuraea bangladeshensis]|uniref:hypothetical protein n=1 Tax=Nonomuraea bangladeshensis TaxID=404385 RepID=UPI003C2F0222